MLARQIRFACTTVLILLASCGGGSEGGSGPNPPPPPPPPPPVATVTVAPDAATLFTSGSTTLTATLRDAAGNSLSGRTISWTSANPNVATVTSAGVVTGVAPGGPVAITATSEGQSGSAQITVIAPVATVTVTPPTSTLLTGATTQLTATLRDAGNNVLSGRTIAWSSSNPAVASVSTNGVVTALAPGGLVTITATSEGKSGTAQVSVIAPVASVTVAPTAASIVVGQTTTLVATPRDAGNNALTGRAITWSSSDPSRATVSQSGVVTAIAAGGPVTITATCEGQSGNAQVTVLAPVSSVVVNGNFRTKVGDAYTYTATARLADGTPVNRPMTWSVEDPATGTMTPSGTLTPLRTGTIVIQVTIDGEIWESDATAYDWFTFGSGTTFGIALVADLQITNKFGTSEYAQLAMGCSGGSFLLFVDTDTFVTQSGGVAYSFDGSAPESATWVEFDSFSALAHPGPNSSTRNFANRMGGAARFGFAFTEFLGSAKATIFRVTGLAARIGSFATCPSPSAPITASSGADPLMTLLAGTGRTTRASAESELRAAFREATTGYPELRIGGENVVDAKRAVRAVQVR